MLIRVLACVALMFAGFIAPAEAGHAAPVVELAILADGSLQVEGKTYSTRPAIAAEIDCLSKRKPQPRASFKIDRHATYGQVEYILAEIQRTRAVTIGIVSTQQ